ncbi:MAG TPA: TonB family protein [Nitrospira sp.]|nr:TonB family protein [Nitrospira sp.]
MARTTPPELNLQLRNGWIGSIALHGLLLLSLLPLFRQSVTAVSKESFHWDVTLVESARTANDLAQSVEAAKSALASIPKSAPLPARSSRHEAPFMRHDVPIVVPTTEPVAPTSQPTLASSSVLRSESSTTLRSDMPTATPPQVSHLPLHASDVPAASTIAEPLTAKPTEVTVNDAVAQKLEPAHPMLLAAEGLVSEAVSTTRPDYGWLQQAIFRRLEKLKRSSHPFVGQSQPMKVMVKAVVSREGTLLDSIVVKSSGLDRIDQEAMILVQRAFPMQLNRTLDRQQIVMRIPITYSQE